MKKIVDKNFMQLCEDMKILWEISTLERNKEHFTPDDTDNNVFSGWIGFKPNQEVDMLIEHIVNNISEYSDNNNDTTQSKVMTFFNILESKTLMRFALFGFFTPTQPHTYQFLPDLDSFIRNKISETSRDNKQCLPWQKTLGCLAWNQNTPLTVLKSFLGMKTHWELYSIARDTIKIIADETTDTDQLRQLANIKVKGVRKMVAGNPYTPKDILEEYATNTKFGREIRKTVAKNPNLTKEAIMFLEKEYKDDKSIFCNLMLNRATPHIVLQKVVDQPTSYDPKVVGLAVQSLYKRTDILRLALLN